MSRRYGRLAIAAGKEGLQRAKSWASQGPVGPEPYQPEPLTWTWVVPAGIAIQYELTHSGPLVRARCMPAACQLLPPSKLTEMLSPTPWKRRKAFCGAGAGKVTVPGPDRPRPWPPMARTLPLSMVKGTAGLTPMLSQCQVPGMLLPPSLLGL